MVELPTSASTLSAPVVDAFVSPVLGIRYVTMDAATMSSKPPNIYLVNLAPLRNKLNMVCETPTWGKNRLIFIVLQARGNARMARRTVTWTCKISENSVKHLGYKQL